MEVIRYKNITVTNATPDELFVAIQPDEKSREEARQLNLRIRMEEQINKMFYLAGLFDGEGWFQIGRMKNDGSNRRTARPFYFQAYAHLCIREKFIVEVLKKEFGGSVRPKIPRNERHSVAWGWTVTCKALDKFIVSMNGKLRVKQKQLEVVRHFRAAASLAANLAMTDQRYDLYCRLWSNLRRLNQKGVGKE